MVGPECGVALMAAICPQAVSRSFVDPRTGPLSFAPRALTNKCFGMIPGVSGVSEHAVALRSLLGGRSACENF